MARTQKDYFYAALRPGDPEMKLERKAELQRQLNEIQAVLDEADSAIQWQNVEKARMHLSRVPVMLVRYRLARDLYNRRSS